MTDRDIEIVRWLGRHRLATAEQVMRRFGLQRSKGYQRLAVVVDAGLVRHETGVRSARVYLATPKGLSAAGLDLPRGTVSPASFAHDITVVDVATPLELAGLDVWSEREIRRPPGHGGNPFQLRLIGAGAAGRGAWPDLVVVNREERCLRAIEVEISLKKAERVAARLLTYVGSQYQSVTYLCGVPAVLSVVKQQAVRVGMSQDQLTGRLLADAPAPSAFGPAALGRRRAGSTPAATSIELSERTAQVLLGQIARYLTSNRQEQASARARWQVLIEGARRHGLLQSLRCAFDVRVGQRDVNWAIPSSQPFARG